MKLTKDMAALRQAARTELDAIFAERLGTIMQPMSPIHTLKAMEAERLLVAVLPLPASPLLDAEAKARGVTVPALAKMVRAKATEQSKAFGALEADRQSAQAAVDGAANPIALDAVLSRYR